MRSEAGYSLLELSVVLVVLGLVVIGASKLLMHAPAKLSAQSGSLPDAIFTVDAAIKGFLFAQARLPCPALNNLGIELCGGGNAVGLVPWRTLGLASMPKNRTGLSIRYGAYRAANATLSLDADLAQAIDRFNPRLPVQNTLPPSIVQAAASPVHINGVDACKGLQSAMATPSASALRVNAVSGLLQRAYVLVDPGPTDADANGNLFDGLNANATTATPLFEMPENAASATYDDLVLAVGFSELWGEMQCSATMSALHAHANVAESAVILQQALKDYRAQLAVMVPLSMTSLTAATKQQIATGAGVAPGVLTAADITTSLNAIVAPTALPNGITPTFTTVAGDVIFSNLGGVPAVLNITAANSILALTAGSSYVVQFDSAFGALNTWNTLTSTVRSNADNADRAALFGQ